MVGYKDLLTLKNLTMKRIYHIIALMLVAFAISGCEKELTSEGVSKLTYYVTFELTGGTSYLSPLGTPFVDPGYKAMEGSTDVTDKVTVEGTVDANTVGLYDLTYSATNVDGFPASETRTVIVYDPAAPATDLSGNYLSDVSRPSPPRSFTGLSVTISKVAPGVFYVSDLLGGFYDQGANYMYGPLYALTGYIQLNTDNTLSYISSYNAAWGDSANSFTNGVFNPATKGLSWKVNYTSSNYNYNVTLTLN
jgi:hypothetical protein